MRTLDENKKIVLRNTALQMITEEGFKGLSMQKLAKAAGISPATIYIYYNDRQDLLNKLYLFVYNESNQAALHGFSADMPFEEGLKTLWINRFKYSTLHPHHAQFLEQFINSPLIAAVTALEETTYPEQMNLFYSNAVKNQQVKAMAIEVYWSIAFAPLYQLIRFSVKKGIHPHNRKGVDEQKLLACLAMVLKALKP